MPEQGISCVEPIQQPGQEEPGQPQESEQKEVPRMATARVGQKAPAFRANAFVDGGFKQVSLSDYSGQWVMVCFYPGDFTFV
jgi:hypothetical protein